MTDDRNLSCLRMIEQFFERYETSSSSINLILSLWQADLDMGSRKTFPAHITASAIAMHDSQILLVKHKFLRRWLFPGGHLDPDETPQDAAMRELLEETGLQGKLGHFAPVDVDCHPIPHNPAKGEPEHFHIDLKFIALVADQNTRVDISEVDALKWVHVEDIPSLTSYKLDLSSVPQTI